jgi:hypothetical protein
MATFRCNPTVALVVFSLACVAREGVPEAAANRSPAAVGVATIQNLRIEHVTPRRDFVGPVPAKLEWTPVDGVDSYGIRVENEIEIPVFDQGGITTTSVPWPKEARVDPGTYYWRIVGLKGDRVVADSGRAAFVVLDP